MKKSVRETFKNNRLRSRYEVRPISEQKLSLTERPVRAPISDLEKMYRNNYNFSISAAETARLSGETVKMQTYLSEAQHWQDLYLYEEEKENAMIEYIRCHFINSENGIQCESWHSVGDGDMCPVHRGMISARLAANGINKEEFINAQRTVEKCMFERIQGLDAQAQANLISEHLVKLEKEIERLKNESLVYRAGMRHVEEGMTEEDRQIRRNMKVPRSEPKARETKTRVKGTPDEMLKAFMAKYPSMSLEAAKDMLGLD